MIDTKPKAAGFVPYKMLAPELQAAARAMRPKWMAEEFDRVQFFVKGDGTLSRRFGHHKLTDEESAAIDEMLSRLSAPPDTKGSLADWKPGVTLHFDREPV